MRFIAHRLTDLLAEARAVLGDYLGAAADDLTFVPNATTGVNLAARALDLRPGDEILTTDLEYGASDLAWRWVCARAGARYVRAPTPSPLAGPDDLLDALRAHRSDRTRAVFVSHVTSETALSSRSPRSSPGPTPRGSSRSSTEPTRPHRCRSTSTALGADFYAGNCHKWLCAPKGSGFLHVRAEHQERVDGAIVSWGYRQDPTFVSRTELQGTRDPAAYLAVPAAIRFQAERGWDEVAARCRALAREARSELCALLGTAPLAPESMLAQMATVRLPRPDPGLGERLFDAHRIEIPVMRPEHELLRISVAAYTTRDDVDRLLSALARELDAEHGQQHDQRDPG